MFAPSVSRWLTNKRHRESLSEELALDLYRVLDDLVDPVLAGLVDEVLEEQAGEVAVQTLVAGDQLIAEKKIYKNRYKWSRGREKKILTLDQITLS